MSTAIPTTNRKSFEDLTFLHLPIRLNVFCLQRLLEVVTLTKAIVFVDRSVCCCQPYRFFHTGACCYAFACYVKCGSVVHRSSKKR